MAKYWQGGACPGCGREGRFRYYEQLLFSLQLRIKAARCRNCGMLSVRGRRMLDHDDLELRRVPLLDWFKLVQREFAEEVERIQAHEEARR